MAGPTFKLRVYSLRGVWFDGQVESVYLLGDEGEFEILAFHYPLLSSLPEGQINIADHDPIPIRVGIVMFQGNTCTIVIEESAEMPREGLSWDAYDPSKGLVA